jgi:hypothetical protein
METLAKVRNLKCFLDAFKAAGGGFWTTLSSLPLPVMPGLVPGVHAFAAIEQERRGWPSIGERKRRRPMDGYTRP